jgi:hypothetical protein
MRRLLILACGLVSLTASAAVATDAATTSGLSATQIVDRTVAARGGVEAWRAVKTMAISGQMEAGGKQNWQLPFVMKMKRSHKSRLEITFQKQTAIQVYDGVQGWKLRPFLGRNDVEPYTPDEAKAAASWEELDGPLVDYAHKGTRISLLGKEAVEGHDAYKLKLTLKDGVERNLWIDAKSFLELKIDGEPRRLDGKLRHVAIYYRDYKPENGLTIPHVLETVIDGGNQSHKMFIERVSFNQPMEDALFAKPELAAMSGQ